MASRPRQPAAPAPAPNPPGGLVVEVALAAPLWQPLSYLVPAELAPLVGCLTRVLVPLRGRPKLGFALAPPRPGSPTGLKRLLDVLDDSRGAAALPPGLLGFFSRAAAYYGLPLGLVLAQALPAGLGSTRQALAPARRPGLVAVAAVRPEGEASRLRPESAAARLWRRLKAQGPTPLPELRAEFPRAAALGRELEARGLLTISHLPLVRDLLGRPLLPEPRPAALTADQAAALARLAPAIQARRFAPFLVEGVTGSGKTELYLAAAEAALALERQVLFLVPEIGLLLRLEGLLADRFGPERVAVLHSGLTPAARREMWRRIAGGQARLVAGARSAVFAPLAAPGLIVVDEEQDEAYKQEERFRYSARDLALLRGQEQGCPVVLGSATPSLASLHKAATGEYTPLVLPRRVRDQPLPAMELVDLRSAGKLVGGFLSPRLWELIKATVGEGRQALLFLNRRGYAPSVVCTRCGKPLGCPACDLSLTLHLARRRLVCHTCGHERGLPEICPACGAPAEELTPLGLGTEAVAERLKELAPAWRLARLDRDTVGDAKRLGALLRAIADHQVDVVIGTQMITKGHHFPGLALVGVLLADQALAVPDFRAAERAQILITQVAGRAGREGGPGRVVVQTYQPEHPALQAALAGDPAGFYQAELAERRALGYPPFTRLALLRLEAVDEAAAQQAARELAGRLGEAARRIEPQARVLGPAPAPVPRVQGRHRRLVLLKASSVAGRSAILRLALFRQGGLPAGVRLAVDIDPLTLA